MKPRFIPYFAYSWLMRFAHRHNWHYVTTSFIEGDRINKCHWCGMTEVLKRDRFYEMKIAVDPRCPRNSILISNLSIPRDTST